MSRPASSSPTGSVTLVPRPTQGRVFTAERRVRLGDVDTSGCLRLDACARYLQDVARDDAADSAIENPLGWVVRRTVVHVVRPPAFQELVRLETWCSGVGSRWAERRTTIVGEHGGLVEAASVWVHLDLETGRPLRLGPSFHERYAASAGGRSADARLRHDPEVPPGADVRHWAWRATDFDVLGHVNNAACGAVVEEGVAAGSDGADRAGLLAELEYRDPALPGCPATLATTTEGDAARIWLLAGERLCFTARVWREPAR
ncbi:MAG TPA: acyl-ACP thioesterase domain-containing protein [Acidimicrobiales bacterium]